MKTTMLPEEPDAKSPAGADVRLLMDGKTGDMIHSTVPAHQTNKATVHATVSEFWYVLEGHGEIWRDDSKESSITVLVPGTSIDVPVGTEFSIPKCFRHRIEVHLHLHAALARRLRSDLCQGYMAANDLMLFYRSEEQNGEKMANTACTGRWGLPLHGVRRFISAS